ncbi:MAG: helix-turn-helix transcriptional regulator, partial [Rhizobiaceae bacterium]
EIKKLSSEGRFCYFVDISFGSIYPTLARLEEEGLVTGKSEVQEGKPDRRTYSITDAGRMELALGLSQPPSKDKFKSEFLLVAINAELAGPAAIKRAITQRIEWLEAELEMLTNVKNECENPATQWVANYGIAVMENDLNYLRKNQNQLVLLASGPAQVEAAE